MAGIKISNLPAASSAQLTDVFPADQTGLVTRKIALSQIVSLFNGNYVQLSPSGAQTITGFGLTVPSLLLGSPLVPSSGGTGIANSNANTLTISAASSINQNVTTTGTPNFSGVVSGSASGAAGNYFQTFSQTSSLGSITFRSNTNSGNYSNILTNNATTAARTWNLPDADGTIALTGSAASGYVLLAPGAPQTITGFGLTVPSLTAGNLNLAGNSLISTSGAINIIPNASSNILMGTTNTFGIGLVKIAKDSTDQTLSIGSFTNTATGPGVYFYKSRNTTVGSNTALQSGDTVGSILFFGSDGSTISQSANFIAKVSGTVSSGVVPTALTWQTRDTFGDLNTGMTLSNAQVLTLANALLPASGGTGTATPPSAGQIPIGTSGNVYTPAAINSGTGIVVANGSGSITVSATGGGLGFATISGTTQTAAVLTRYLALNSGQTTLTLPAVYAVGDIVALIGSTANTGGWVIQASSGDTVRVNNSTTSAGGTVTCTAVAGQCIELVCDVANTSWVMTSTASVLLTTA